MLRQIALTLAFSSLTVPMTAHAQRTTRAVSADTQRVVFVCEHGSVKSMIAANLFNRMAVERGVAARAVSRGTAPDRTVPELVRSGLRRDGIDIGNVSPVGLGIADARETDLFVAFDVDVPSDVSKRAEVRRWDSTPSVMQNFAAGRDAIAANVTRLVDELARLGAQTIESPRRAPTARTPQAEALNDLDDTHLAKLDVATAASATRLYGTQYANGLITITLNEAGANMWRKAVATRSTKP
jgi:arsenate reductase